MDLNLNKITRLIITYIKIFELMFEINELIFIINELIYKIFGIFPN